MNNSVRVALILKDLTANSQTAAIPLDEDSNGLPASKVWTTLRGHELQVRIDPVPSERYPETNKPEDIRMELGQTGTSEQAGTFMPWELETEIIRTEGDSVIYRFSGDRIDAENLKLAKISLTSFANRQNGAAIIRDFEIDY